MQNAFDFSMGLKFTRENDRKATSGCDILLVGRPISPSSVPSGSGARRLVCSIRGSAKQDAARQHQID